MEKGREGLGREEVIVKRCGGREGKRILLRDGGEGKGIVF